MRPALVLAALLLALPALAPPDAAAARSFEGLAPALASLRDAQGVDGGWGRRADTDWVMIGLAAAEEDVAAWGVEPHLLANPPDPLSLLAWERATLALACAGFDARNFHGLDYALVVELGFAGTQFGNPAWLHDDYWGILALRAAGTPADDPRIRLSAAHVLAGQDASGGWSWGVGLAPDVDDTGAALMALAASGHPERGPAVARALDYLRAAQDAAGGWPNQPGGEANLLSTAWASMGLLAVGEDPGAWTTPEGGDPLGVLALLQRAEGGFAYAPAATATAPALTGTALVPLLGRSYACGALSSSR